jgi:hypothetical protein
MSALDPAHRDALVEHGLVWQHQSGLHTHTLVAGMSRTLREQGVPRELITELLVETAKAGSRIGSLLATRVRDVARDAQLAPSPASGNQRRADLALLTAQLLATGFEVTCARAAAAKGPAS